MLGGTLSVILRRLMGSCMWIERAAGEKYPSQASLTMGNEIWNWMVPWNSSETAYGWICVWDLRIWTCLESSYFTNMCVDFLLSAFSLADPSNCHWPPDLMAWFLCAVACAVLKSLLWCLCWNLSSVACTEIFVLIQCFLNLLVLHLDRMYSTVPAMTTICEGLCWGLCTDFCVDIYALMIVHDYSSRNSAHAKSIMGPSVVLGAQWVRWQGPRPCMSCWTQHVASTENIGISIQGSCLI